MLEKHGVCVLRWRGNTKSRNLVRNQIGKKWGFDWALQGAEIKIMACLLSERTNRTELDKSIGRAHDI